MPVECASAPEFRVEVNDKLFRVRLIDAPVSTPAVAANTTVRAPRGERKKGRAGHSHGNDVVSPMHGVIVELNVAAGDLVEQNQVVAVIEAMKMMNEIRAHKSGTVATVHEPVGVTVEANAPLITIE